MKMQKNNYSVTSKAVKITSTILLTFGFCAVQAQSSFPFSPIAADNDDGTFNTTININGNASSFNNLLLGSNVDVNTTNLAGLNNADLLRPNGTILQRNRGFQGFNSQIAQDFIEDRDPVVIRFPQGVFANSYNWERITDSNGNEIAAADSRHITDPFIVDGRTISQHDSPSGVRVGYPSLRGIFDTAERNNRPLDLLTVLNVVGNDGVSNGRRWESMINDGFDVRDMELGNEFFFRSQRTGRINTESAWVDRASRIVTNIRGRARRLNRSVRFAIPITYRASDPTEPQARRESDQRFNDAITADESFFDAIVVHRYIREQREDGIVPGDLTPTNLRRLLTASRIMDQSLSYCRTQVSENKNSIWLTEWGVGGSEEEGVGASFLGTADTYTHLIRNRDRLELERINWFSTFGSNAQYRFENGVRRSTGYGRIYEILRSVLRDSNIYDDIVVTTEDLVSGGRNMSRAVNAIAVSRGSNRITYVVTNLANRATRLQLRRDGDIRTGFDVRLSGISMSNLITLNPTIREAVTRRNQNSVTIPRFSVMRVEVTFDNPVAKFAEITKETIDSPEKSVVLHPNPTSSAFNIALNGLETANIVISDMLGKVVYKTQTNETNLKLDNSNLFKTGVYIVRVIDGNNKTYFNKLIVN